MPNRVLRGALNSQLYIRISHCLGVSAMRYKPKLMNSLTEELYFKAS